MDPCFQFRRIIFAIAIVGLALPGVTSATRHAYAKQASETAFRQIFSDVTASDPMFGPKDGDLVTDIAQPDFQDVQVAGVWVRDAAVHVIVPTPEGIGNDQWHMSVGMRSGQEPHYRFWVNSDGEWFLTEGYGKTIDKGQIDAFSAQRDDSITIDIVVVGETAYAAVNNEFVAELQLSNGIGPGDYSVSVGSPGAKASFEDFTVWSIDPNGFQYRRGAAELGSDAAGAAMLEGMITRVDGQTPDFGPIDGDLEIANAASVPTEVSKIQARDFVLHTGFESPFTPSDESWDVGIVFRTANEPEVRFILDSWGHWYLTFGSGDPSQIGFVRGLDTEQGGSTSVDLVVVGDRGYIAINGDYLATLDLPIGTEGGDIYIGTSFYGNDISVGAVIPFKDFSVWSLDD